MKKGFAVPLLITPLLAACGGGGGSSTPSAPDTAVGIYSGTTGDARTLASMVLTNGTFYYFYSGVPTTSTVAATSSAAATTTTTTNPVGGVVIGTGSGKNGSFSSSTAYDYQVASTGLSTGAFASTLSASYTTASSMAGTITHTSNSSALTFTSTYSSTLSSASPSLSSVAGIYSGTVGISGGGTETITVSVYASGVINGFAASGCSFSGTIAPHSTNNAYDLSTTFNASSCTYNGLTLTGLGLFNSTTGTLYGAVVKTDKTAAVIMALTKVS